MNDNVFVLILWLNEICTPGIMFRRCDDRIDERPKGYLAKRLLIPDVKKWIMKK